MFVNRLRRHGPQIELQAAREHRYRHFLRVGGGKDEFQVLGRLLQRLEHGVESRGGEHMDFVDHEDLEAPLHGLVHRLFQQALHLVHAAVGGGVQLGVVGEASAVDGGAGGALAARLGGDAALPVQALAVERFGQNARHRGLTHAARAGEQVGMVQALLRQGIGEGLHHMLLPNHFSKIARAVFARQDEVRHRAGILCAAHARPGGPDRHGHITFFLIAACACQIRLRAVFDADFQASKAAPGSLQPCHSPVGRAQRFKIARKFGFQPCWASASSYSF